MPRFKHEAWHRVFDDKTPKEALVHIIQCFAPVGTVFTEIYIETTWEKTIDTFQIREPIRIAHARTHESEVMDAWRTLFERKSFFSILAEIVCDWAPHGYFSNVIVRGEYRARKVTFHHHER